MSRKYTWLMWLSLFAIVSMALVACSANATPTPEPTKTVLPSNYETIASPGFGFVWSGPGDAHLKDDYITFTTDEYVVYLQSRVENATVTKWGDDAIFYVNVEETYNNGLAQKEEAVCEDSDGDSVSNDGGKNITNVFENETFSVTCALPSGNVIVGTVEVGKIADFVQTLTAKPTNTPTKTATPRVMTYDQKMQTQTALYAPSATITPAYTPTSTATMRGDHCPKVLPKEFAVWFQYGQGTNTVIMTATTCIIRTSGGKELYGVKSGEKWQWLLNVDPDDGSVIPLGIKPQFVVDHDRCWFLQELNGFVYIQCPHGATPTPTATSMPSSTPTATATGKP